MKIISILAVILIILISNKEKEKPLTLVIHREWHYGELEETKHFTLEELLELQTIQLYLSQTTP